MTFNSLTFVVFFLVVLGIHNLPIPWRWKKGNLLGASYIFYAAWNPPFVLLLWLSTVVDWFVAKRMYKAEGQSRNGWLVASLCTNLGILGYFKYGDFLLQNFVTLAASLGISYQPAELSIILPMGISFYTFQTLSYTIDIYRGQTKPWHSFLDYALYVTFFPQLVAGPIVRAVDFLPQCIQPKRATAQQLGWGLTLLTVGLFQKIILADKFLAPVADAVYSAPDTAGFLNAWAGTLAFSGQIFCDFSGYSCCGIGAALCLGFAIPDNFRFPYAAIGFSDFWRRWHISLSSWLRDYLYIPLGGNRHGTVIRSRNLLFTMLLGGLWHGAAWHFVAWGGLHGLYLFGEVAAKKICGSWAVWEKRWAQFFLAIVTFLLVCLTWVFFRSQDFSTAFTLLSSMFYMGPTSVALSKQALLAVAIVAGLVGAHWLMRDKSFEELAGKMPTWVIILGFLVAFALITMTHGEDRGFIYFQF